MLVHFQLFSNPIVCSPHHAGVHLGCLLQSLPTEICHLSCSVQMCSGPGLGQVGRTAPEVPTFFDEAGHRVATQYLFAVLHGQMAVNRCYKCNEITRLSETINAKTISFMSDGFFGVSLEVLFDSSLFDSFVSLYSSFAFFCRPGGCWNTGWVTRPSLDILSLASRRASNLARVVWDTFGAM